MNRDFYTDEFEQLLKEKSDQFRMYPSKRVWHSIYNDLHPSRRWPSAAMSMFLIIALLLIGYINTSDNTITNQFANNTSQGNEDLYNNKNTIAQKPVYTHNKKHQLPNTGSEYIAKAFVTKESEISVYSDVKTTASSNTELALNDQENKNFTGDNKASLNTDKTLNQATESNNKDIIEAVDTYIKTNQIFSDVAAVNNKKVKVKVANASAKTTNPEELNEENENELNKVSTVSPGRKTVIPSTDPSDAVKPVNENAKKELKADTKSATEEKAWIENYAFQNKPERKRWKDRLAIEFYITPAVNYRKLTTNSKGSPTAFANSDINNSISQKPGFGMESGVGLSYAFAKNLRLKAGVQFDYTNYNINADQTNHPILTTILLNDPNTGYSYSDFRTSSISNAYNSSALQPVILHNRTYQISIPVGLAYKLSSTNNVEWFAGASIQPTYVFGGKAHLISTDLKSYVSEPSSIRNWNLNLGFETYMNYKLGAYNLQVGPQVRYQIYSTYRKNIALVEKPYAVGLKLGLVKGF